MPPKPPLPSLERKTGISATLKLKDIKRLEALAHQQGRSVGQLVVDALAKTYGVPETREEP